MHFKKCFKEDSHLQIFPIFLSANVSMDEQMGLKTRTLISNFLTVAGLKAAVLPAHHTDTPSHCRLSNI